jgi:hypothetical protein
MAAMGIGGSVWKTVSLGARAQAPPGAQETRKEEAIKEHLVERVLLERGRAALVCWYIIGIAQMS